MPALSEPKLIAGNANPSLARAIARRMSLHRGVAVEPVKARVERFADQEIFVEVFENVRGEDMFIIQPTSNPANDTLMELLIITDALRRSSAARITAVIPYFGYARQDRRAKARTPISAKLVANLLTRAGIDRILTLDLHAAQIQGFFDIPVDNLYAAPIFALDILHHFDGQCDGMTVVSPDVGGVARARELAQRIGCGLAIVDKRRPRPGEVGEMTIIGDVKDQICVIVDDICDTAGTLCKAAEVLCEAGAREVHAYITHGVLSGPAVDRIKTSRMKSLVITDSIEQGQAVREAGNIRIVPTAPMFAQAILNIWHGTSVSSLFEADSLAPIYEGMYAGR
ncbi:ribose-phosphate pyrophosphokinase [Rubellimicrobium sp. CFH 75288]|uniref:ribose-phosphate pyrophosphokinase n=1 Tax=Rubellimicrobium sp. CFH 75288 TaxID=2697034 RepID=UPI001412929E|nr:ribose-phosphate pyrophosphokinase [Rubellimicrobium sp. CFH 75288]NAZ36512.1 ribose-phosphate diphosphokinase [Rubellimicrobium sp. CFH 75288]